MAVKSQENKGKETRNDMATNEEKDNSRLDLQRPHDSERRGQGNGKGISRVRNHQDSSATRQCPPTHHIDGKATLTKDATGRSDREEVKRRDGVSAHGGTAANDVNGGSRPARELLPEGL